MCGYISRNVQSFSPWIMKLVGLFLGLIVDTDTEVAIV
jgi:high-affinity nickel permease